MSKKLHKNFKSKYLYFIKLKIYSEDRYGEEFNHCLYKHFVYVYIFEFLLTTVSWKTGHNCKNEPSIYDISKEFSKSFPTIRRKFREIKKTFFLIFKRKYF